MKITKSIKYVISFTDIFLKTKLTIIERAKIIERINFFQMASSAKKIKIIAARGNKTGRNLSKLLYMK